MTITTPLADPVHRSPEPVAPPPAAPSPTAECDVCPHPVDDHDAIGLRFCRATRAAGADRGCACR